jgi:hypothetical protein
MRTGEVPAFSRRRFSALDAHNNPREMQQTYLPIRIGRSAESILKHYAKPVDIANIIPPARNNKATGITNYIGFTPIEESCELLVNDTSLLSLDNAPRARKSNVLHHFDSMMR